MSVMAASVDLGEKLAVKSEQAKTKKSFNTPQAQPDRTVAKIDAHQQIKKSFMHDILTGTGRVGVAGLNLSP